MAKKKVSKKRAVPKKADVKPRGEKFGRGLWRGSIAFGLVNIPVTLESAQQEQKIRFHLLDKRDNGPIGYKQYNKKTGREIDRKNIIKAYECEKGQYVLLSDVDFEKANPKATRSIDIEDFISIDDIDPMLFDRPYYVVPQKGGEKSYALLREVLAKSGKAGIAKIVLHSLQHLAAIFVREDYIILELLRFADEVREISEVPRLEDKARISDRELDIAEQLVEGMTSKWDPSKYRDTYREDMMHLIEQKIKSGKTAEVDEVEPAESNEEEISNVIDLTALLKKSLEEGGKKRVSRRSLGEKRAQ